MKIYDTLIKGCGYAPAGYAAANKNTIICEEHQICDTNFYLPLNTFCHTPYAPVTVEGKKLQKVFDDLSIFSEKYQNTNAFECGFCKYLVESPLDILLKCRVIKAEKKDDIYIVTIQTNEGLSHLYARQIIDCTNTPKEKIITVLFTSSDIQHTKKALLSAFDNAIIESTFYKSRYAIHIDVGNSDENTAKLHIYNKWRTLDTDSKIIYIAPVFLKEKNPSNILCDVNYKNPIEAFERGYNYGKEAVL